MDTFPKKLDKKLSDRAAQNSLRRLPLLEGKVDFSSNDYLGIAKNPDIFYMVTHLLEAREIVANGSTGSRLLTGNSQLFVELEGMLERFHEADSALVFNSGYDANVGFFSAVPQRNDLIFYDEYIHASIRDGISMAKSNAFKFAHNDLHDLEESLRRNRKGREDAEIYVVTESIFSMDGDSPDLGSMVRLSREHNYRLIVDEAHAVGVFGGGLVQELGFHKAVFARLVTFGKAIGAHGAAILGSERLKQYLFNFCRSFIYTTALPPHALATIPIAYEQMAKGGEMKKLKDNISIFKQEISRLGLPFIQSDSAIQCCMVSGNGPATELADNLQREGFDVRAILYPTVPKGSERLRFCIHSYNSEGEIVLLLGLLAKFM
ncbi:MAG: 8-amino-7-oxononanoate synthase [Sediminicola sp.]